MEFKPLGERIIVRRDEAVTETKSGIVFALNDKDRTTEGVIVAAGPGVRADDMKVGDRIMFGAYSGQSVKQEDGTELLFLYQTEVIAVIEPAEAA